MITSTAFQKLQSSVLRSRTFRARLLINGLQTSPIETDISSFITNFGNVSRRLTFDIGNFSPGNHSFNLQNTKDLGEFFFTFGINLGENFWMDLEYELLLGFYDATNVSTERNDRDFIQYFTGIIQGKSENRINGKITIQAKDLTQSILDKKVCTLLAASDVFDNQTGTDDRAFQQFIKYGMHRLIQNSSDKSQLNNRNNPFTAMVAHPNLAIAKGIDPSAGSPTNRDPFRWFYVPTQNKISGRYGSEDNIRGTHNGSNNSSILVDTSASFLAQDISNGDILSNDTDGSSGMITKITKTTIEASLSGGTDNDWDIGDNYSIPVNNPKEIYYWDYREDKKRWVKFVQTDITTSNISVQTALPNKGGIYLEFVTDFEPDNSEWPGGDWDDYVDGTSVWATGSTTETVDPAIAVEVQGNILDNNPVRIIDNLLTDSLLTNLDDTTIDKSTNEFTAIDLTYTFDRAFQFYDDDTGQININKDSETSIFKIIQDIVKLTGLYFFTSAKKSVSEDRRIRLVINTPINTCDPAGDPNLVLPSFSTKNRILSYVYTTNNSSVFDKFLTTYFSPGTSTKNSFDIKTRGSGPKVLQFAASTNPVAYWFDSPGSAEANINRRFNQLSIPAEELNLEIDASAIDLELGDIITIHDAISDSEITVQIFEMSTNINNGQIRIKARRYELLYGPDAGDPTKLWAFVDCAFVDADSDGNTYHVF